MYLLKFDQEMVGFEWRKIDIACTGPRAHHSAAYLQRKGQLAILGGIHCDEQGLTTRHNLSVILVNVSTWSWDQIVVSDNIFLSSTKLLTVHDSKLLYIGGYTSKIPSINPDDNAKTSFWGTLSIVEGSPNTVNVSLDAKETKFNPFAAGNAIKVGKEILISCGTEPMWGVLTANLPLAQTCDLPTCTINSSAEPVISKDNWIRCDGRCRRWVHFSCAGIDSNARVPTKYFCKRTDCRENCQKGPQRSENTTKAKPPLLQWSSKSSTTTQSPPLF